MRANLSAAVEKIRNAKSLLITSGAGMSHASGLGTYRGYGSQSFGLTDPQFSCFIQDSEKGPWELRGFQGTDASVYRQVMNPKTFEDDPDIAWGFVAQRLHQCYKAEPHPGYYALLRILDRLKTDYFVFTTNVDGYWLRAGYDPSRVVERHGSLLQAQCSQGCPGLWSVDHSKLSWSGDSQPLLTSEPPRCPQCNAIARPAAYLFSDGNWNKSAYRHQRQRFHEWKESVGNTVVLELGAGIGLATARNEGEDLKTLIVRVNLDEKAFQHRNTYESLDYAVCCSDFLLSLEKEIDKTA